MTVGEVIFLISDESDEVLETGGGLKKAAAYFDEGSFVLMNADILTDLDLKKMISFHKEKKPLATLAVTNRKSSRYFLFDNNDRLCRMAQYEELVKKKFLSRI